MAGTRPPGFGGPRSEILRIDGEGGVTTVARLQDDTVHSLLWLGERLWVGTGLEGKLYSLRGTDLVLEGDVEERQLMALLPDQAAAGVRHHQRRGVLPPRPPSADSRQGTYTSPVLDALQIARFGSFRWMGEEPRAATLRFSFRSGIAAEPDATWSPWTGASRRRRRARARARRRPLGALLPVAPEAKAEGDGVSAIR